MAKTPSSDHALTADERRCLEQLEDWQEEIRDLLMFIGMATTVAHDKHKPSSRDWAAEARARLKTLKRDLDAEAKRLSLREQRGELNVAESRYYPPDIRQSAAYLTLNVRSTDGEEWRQRLGEALTTIRNPLFQLQAKRDAKKQ